MIEAARENSSMSVIETAELSSLFERIKGLSLRSRIRLARRILESLEALPEGETDRGRPIEGPTRGVPVEAALGLLKTDRKPPSDEECRAIVEEERWKKYGI